jgi:sterol desaturase/sphingolipid hydroxylase (fatty acid hydroxylase superfamily)
MLLQPTACVDFLASFGVWLSLISLPLFMTYDDNYKKFFDASWYDTEPRDYWNSHDYPPSLGLWLGISAVVVGHFFVLVYFIAKLKGKLGSAPVPIQKEGAVKYELSEGLRTHLEQLEGFILLGAYLSLTWMFGLLPKSYYSFSGGISWIQLAQQLILQDFIQTMMHWLEHNFNKFSVQAYVLTHKPHHRFTNPRLFDAFNGSFGDTLCMILMPLYLTSLCVSTNVWTYMAFGATYASWLTLIHSEFTHPWEWAFRMLGLGTAADHHVHHKLYNYNYGHLLMWWDFIFGNYRSPSKVATFTAER